jgi:hypothetical protein
MPLNLAGLVGRMRANTGAGIPRFSGEGRVAEHPNISRLDTALGRSLWLE